MQSEEPVTLPSAATEGSTAPTIAGGIVGVIVAYHPSPALRTLVEHLRPQVGAVVVVDNGSRGEAEAVLRGLEALDGVHLLRNRENRGVAAALNQGARWALERGARWLVTFDQDSDAPRDFVAALTAAYAACPDRGRVAVVGPVYVDRETGFVSSFARRPGGAEPYAPAEVTLTSGSLVDLPMLVEHGWFDEGLFIDYVDIEYCLRCARHGRAVIEARDARLPHRLGAFRRHRWLGREVGVTHHPPFRRYYLARNRVAVYRRYLRERPRWVLGDLRRFAAELAKLVAFEDRVGEKLAAVARGLWDGLKGRTGRCGP